jgi:hypothetical protein
MGNYAFHASHDDIIVASIHDTEGDSKSLQEAQSRTDWPSCRKAAMEESPSACFRHMNTSTQGTKSH